MQNSYRLYVLLFWIAGISLLFFNHSEDRVRVQAFAGSKPNNSSPIVLNNGNRFVWVVNPDNDSISRIDVGDELNISKITINVGKEPQSLALSVDDTKVYVANTETELLA